MFVDFDSVFSDEKKPEFIVPQGTIDFLSKQLPKGTKYVMDEEGNCTITGDDQEFILGGFSFVLTKEHKKILGSNPTLDEVTDYFYNAQKQIPLKLKKKGYVTINGEEIEVEKLYINRMNPIKVVDDSFFMTPAKFPEPFSLTVGCEGYDRVLDIRRIPNESINIAAFQSGENEPFVLNILVDQTDHKMTITFSFNLSRAKTIRDMVESIKIYNAFVEGKGTMDGKLLDANIVGEVAESFDPFAGEFWEKVLNIEVALDVSFVPPQEDVDVETVRLVEKLYQCLINKKAIKNKDKVETVDGKWTLTEEKRINEAIGVPVYFMFESTNRIELFGVKIVLPGLMGIFNAIFKDYSKKEDLTQITLGDESEEKTRYTVELWFKNDEELEEYKKFDHNRIMKEFGDAKTVDEFLV